MDDPVVPRGREVLISVSDMLGSWVEVCVSEEYGLWDGLWDALADWDLADWDREK